MAKIGRFIRKISKTRSDSEGSSSGEDEILSTDISQDYELIWSRIGSGISGGTYMCASRFLGYKYALKILEDNKRSREEVNLQRKFRNSENVVPIIDVFRCVGHHPGSKPGVKYLYIVMELQGEGNLFQFIKCHGGVREETAVHLMKQVVYGLQSLHKQGIIHKDLKPENILLSEGEDKELCAKLSDFGFSCQEKSRPTRVEYTPYYVAPEVLCKDRQYNPYPTSMDLAPYDHRCDIWSLGVVLYCLLLGETPFFSEINYNPLTQLMYDNIQNARYKISSEEPAISTEARDLINALLKSNPDDRCSLEKVLSHPWFEKFQETTSFQSSF
ncbi:MAP kinase activated protein kinase 2 [Oopsacas minuta]|uniref:MAP kinase activated protein kinase 2 n=1 Tax=Oopsacas minuta TaxID=111878 RepID=A0AAV7KC56_9METZ|nr:MAP kinase activated protein kinase 2 [Oopsacas minuta]